MRQERNGGVEMGFRKFGIFWHPNFQILASGFCKNLATLNQGQLFFNTRKMRAFLRETIQH